MLNSRPDHLPPYPFPRLNALLDGIAPGKDPLILSIGEPQHQPPALLTETLVANADTWNKYPQVFGTPGLRGAITGAMNRRYHLPDGMLDPDRHILPVAGTREALYLIAAVIGDQDGSGPRPTLILPNPFYQPYAAAGLMHGFQLHPLDATAETGFLPDLDALTPEALDRAALFYLCSPANPQGAVADKAYLKRALDLCRAHNVVLVMDECYADIYDTTPPTGMLEICADQGGDMTGVLCFHSLSKRSSAAGLRSGFAVGDPALIKAFAKLRSYCSAVIPMPLMAASAALWEDEAHVIANRNAYRAKIDAAEEIFGPHLGFYRPAGGFFLWLDVGDGETAAKRLWAEAGIKAIPGAYLTSDAADGSNHGARYLRLALVHDLDICRAALTRVAETLID